MPRFVLTEDGHTVREIVTDTEVQALAGMLKAKVAESKRWVSAVDAWLAWNSRYCQVLDDFIAMMEKEKANANPEDSPR